MTNQPVPTTKSIDYARPPEQKFHPMLVFVWGATAAFLVYFCMYAFRKPFAVAQYQDVEKIGGLTFKTLAVSSQLIGYTISKFIGIKVISELPARQRAVALLVLIGVAQLALVGFAVIPAPHNVWMMLINGLPLGMVFGLVMGFLEGRRQTEAMLAVLCASFVLADGVTKGAGAMVLQWGVSAFWMPATVGLLFSLPLVLSTILLAMVPKPSAADVEARTERVTMDGRARFSYFNQFAVGLVLLCAGYVLLTMIRGIRGDFAAELWKSLGVNAVPSDFATTEMWVALGLLIVTGMTAFIRDNKLAFFVAIGMSVAALILGMVVLSLQQAGALSGYWFVVLIGFALYVPYMAVHTTIFERLIAYSRQKATAGYLMYVVDAFGYLGLIILMFAKDSMKELFGDSFLTFFRMLAWAVMLGCAVMFAGAAVWFWGKFAAKRRESSEPVLAQAV